MPATLQLKIIHLRKMASRDGLLNGKIREGVNFYITGYHPVFLFARCLYHLKDKPFLASSSGVFFGYLKSWFRGEPLVVSPEEKKFLRSQQLRRLFLGKK